MSAILTKLYSGRGSQIFMNTILFRKQKLSHIRSAHNNSKKKQRQFQRFLDYRYKQKSILILKTTLELVDLVEKSNEVFLG